MNGFILTDKNFKQGTVISLDRLPIYPIAGALVLGSCDFTKAESREKLLNLLDVEGHGKGVDLMLSDMAPNATGVRAIDQEVIISLAYSFVR
jgi:23S rRNA (uridine2552-2'-O)-methyltransferase